MTETKSLYGKPWTIESTHNTYESASKKREKLGDDTALQVKIKRTPSGLFTVRTRSTHVEVPKKKEKRQDRDGSPDLPGKPRSRSEKRKLRQKRKEQKRR